MSVAFSPDSKLLITQGGAPDWTLCYWSWEKAKVIASVKASNSQTTAIHQCSFNPQDNTLVCISGNGLFRMLRCTEGTMKPLAAVVGKRDSQNMLCHAWVSEERVVVGTDNGELLLFDMGEFKLVLPQSPADGASIDVIITCAKGFICGGSAGTIHLFEKTDDKDYYKNAKTFHVENHQAKIKSLAISPSEESLVCTLDNNQIIVLAISSSDIVHETSLEHLSRSCHSTAVTGLDSCLRKPIFATCATDRSVRIWNYRSNINELTKFFTEEAYSIAFHPSGYHILIGFSDKLRFMNLLMGDISKVFEFDIRSCRECKFSNGGQFFAAVHGNLIQIFSTYTFENTGNLRGHSGKVRTIYWTPDDTKIISAGLDGAVYEWNVREGKRLSENVLKSCNYTSAVSNETAKSIYAVGSDKKLKEIGDSQINKDIDSTVCITQLAIAQSGRLLFAGTETGAIRLYKLPLTGDFTEYQCHAAPVTRLRVAYDDTLLFSTAEDSTVAVLEIRDKDRKAIKTVLETDFAEEILIARSDIEEKNATINEMKNKYDELTLQHEYQMKLKELNHSEKMKELVEKMNHDIDAWKIKYDALVQEKNEAEMQALDNTRQLEAKHLAKTQEMDRKYQQKIVDEVERYHHLLRNKEEMQEESERHVALIKENHFKVTKDMSEDYTFKYREELNKLEKFREEKDMIVREFEETKRQMEEDAEHELDDMKDSYEGKLASERQATVRLKGENNVMKKRFTSLQKDIEDHKEEINSLFEQKKQLYHTIHGLEKEIASLKKEIKERDETIGDKEKRIYDLKKKNQELEKFKFVLDYKIKELKKQIEPLNQEITEMRGQIKEMDGELERYHKTCANQELASSELHMKVEALNKEVVAERQKKASVETLIRRMKSDLQEIIQHIQSPKELKEGVKRLYHKYMEDQAEDGEGNVLQHVSYLLVGQLELKPTYKKNTYGSVNI